jgi:uncharacterized SAM-binding protein YcdF (DUF218 family)
MKKAFKIIRYLVYAVCVVFVITLGIVIGIGHWHRPVGNADAIVVLGAAIKTPASYNRALQGLKLYEEGKAPVLVLSGGVDYPKSISEAQYMRDAVLDEVARESANDHPHPVSSTGQALTSPLQGEEKIKVPMMILESSSQSTFENIKNSKQFLPDAHSVIIVSDTYHLARGVLTAKAQGFGPVYWSAPKNASYYPLTELIFHYLRETMAMISYLPKFILR